jgi:amino acid transporter
MIGVGLLPARDRAPPAGESAASACARAPRRPRGSRAGVPGAAAFSSGCTALTGVEAISNGVPAFRKPKSQERRDHAAAAGRHRGHDVRRGHVLTLAINWAKVADTESEQLIGAPADGYQQRTVIAQIAESVFHGFTGTTGPFYFVTFVTALILVLAANTAFNGFPVLGSILAQDRYLPRQLHTRGDRLAFSNGIVFLAFFAIVLIVAFQAEVTR